MDTAHRHTNVGAPTCKHTYTHADMKHQWRPVKVTDVGVVLPGVGGMFVALTSFVLIQFFIYYYIAGVLKIV